MSCRLHGELENLEPQHGLNWPKGYLEVLMNMELT